MIKKLIVLLIFYTSIILPTSAQETGVPDYGFVEASVDNLTPYAGQKIVFTFRYYDTGNATEKRYIPPEFTGFGQETQPETAVVELLNNVQYNVITQETILTATRNGRLIINPARVIIPETPFQQGAVLETTPIIVTVQPLPGNAPQTFIGAVGQFDMSVDIAPQEITIGDAIQLTIRLTGSRNGNIEQLLAPSLQFDESIWRSNASESRYEESQFVGTKIFEWNILPRSAGRYTISPIVFTYFDPETESYQTLSSEPVTISVTEITNVAPVATPIATTTPTTSRSLIDQSLEFRPRPASFTTTSPTPSILFWLLWLIPPMIVIGFIIWNYDQKRRKEQNQIQRQKMALKTANTKLKRATQETPDKAYQLIHSAIYAYFSDKLGANRRNFTKSDIEVIMQKYPIEVRRRLQQCIQNTEARKFAPISNEDIPPLVTYTLETLKQVDDLWSNTATS